MYGLSGAGTQKGSSQESHMDFVNHWADRTVEEAVIRGAQLRQQKTHPLPKREHDVVNIDIIKAPRCMIRGKRRKKSPKKRIKPQSSRSISQCCQECQQDSPTQPLKTKRCHKIKKKVLCGMRIAELAVPTKRHCLDTWRNRCYTLPEYMIERLRHYVMDQRPIVQISDAIYCFQRKCKMGTKSERAGNKNTRSKKSIKKTLRNKEVKTLGAIFGYNIAKKLNIPLNIILNSDLQKIANVISSDIEDLVCKSKKININNTMNKAIHDDITKKVTIWISDVLEESNYKYLEDELKDFEEEAGPALDVVEELFDGVLDICIPRVKRYDESRSSNYSEAEGLGEDTESHFSFEKGSLEIESLLEDDKNELPETGVNDSQSIGEHIDTKSEEYVDIDNDQGVHASEEFETDGKGLDNATELSEEKNEENSSFGILPDELLSDGKSEDNVEFDDVHEENHTEANFDQEMTNNMEPSDTAIKKDEYLDSEDHGGEAERTSVIADIMDTDVDYEDNSKTTELPMANGYNEQNAMEIETSVALDENKSRENIPDTGIKNDEYLDSEDLGGEVEKTSLIADAIDTEVNNEDIDPDQQVDNKTNGFFAASFDETNRKVTFDEMAADDAGHATPITDEANLLDTKPSIEIIDFAPPNDDLLSDADESWPDEIQPPFLRPSQSVSKSITSLGKINENEEKSSVLPDDKISSLDQGENDPNFTLETKTDLIPEERPSVEVQDLQDLTENQIDPVSEKKNFLEDAMKKELTDIVATPAPAKADDSKAQSQRTPSKSSNNSTVTGSKKTPFKSRKTSISASEREKEMINDKMNKPTGKKASKKRIKSIKITIGIGNKPGKPIPDTGKVVKRINEGNISISNDIRKDIETPGTSQRAKELDKCLDVEKKTQKPNYRVDAKSAPAWVTRKVGEPSCSCVNIVSKPKIAEKRNINEQTIRRWCNDVEQGYKNLKIWNEWIDNTSRAICVLRREIGSRECFDKCPNKEWTKLKRNIDKDAVLWKKMNQTTQERLTYYRKMYKKRTEVPKKYRTSSKDTCHCSQPKLYNI